MDLVCWKIKQEKLFSLYKMAENLQSLSSFLDSC